MQRRKTIGIGAINNFMKLVIFIELLLGVTQYLEDLILVALIHFCPVVHLDLFDVLLSLSCL